ncbi:MAG: hydrogenase expression/formation protein HypE [Promethearchaeota archaeon]
MSEKKKLELVTLGHGGGGILQGELIKFITEKISIKKIANGIGINDYDDGATIPLDNYDYEIVVTADGHTVDPIFFPGGDLGKLSICGTVNDLIMMGAKPLALTSVVLIEEGTSFEFLGKIMDSFNKTAGESQIAILAGDTKVMPRGSLKEIVITTTGIGIKPKDLKILDSNCKPEAKIILTGSIGDHGAALIARREGIDLETKLLSDVTALTPLYDVIKDQPGILAMKDPTRGGLAAALNEWAEKSNVSIWVEESQLLIKREVKAISDILGLDPLEIANEGKAIICVESQFVAEVLEKVQKTSIGKNARIIAEVKKSNPKTVIMETPLGSKRIIEKPMGELIPRIC